MSGAVERGGHTRILLMVAAVVFAVCVSCEGPFVWRAQIKSFVEDGLCNISLEDFSVRGHGEAGLPIPSRQETVVHLYITNPRSIGISGSVTWEDDSLFNSTPVLTVIGPDEMRLEFTPSLLAERRNLIFTLNITAPGLNRTYEPGQVELRCNTPPGSVSSTLDAALDPDGFAFAAFRLPNSESDTDLSLVEVTYRPAAAPETVQTVELPVDDQSLLEVITNASGEDLLGTSGPLNRYFRPVNTESGEDYLFTVVVIDTEGLRSTAATFSSKASVYSVTYHGKGSTGGDVPIDTATYRHTNLVTVLDPEPLVRTGWVFTGWNTAADGTGTWYQPDDEFPMPDHDVALYAQWVVCGTVELGFSTPEYLAVLFVWNDEPVTSLSVTRSDEPLSISYTDSGSSVNGWKWYLDDQDTVVRTGSYELDIGTPGVYTISCSAVSGGVRYSGSLTVTVNEPFTLSYNGNGADSGTPPEGAAYTGEQLYAAGNEGGLSRSGFSFAGWNTASDGSGTSYTQGDAIILSGGSVTLYAVWEDIAPSPVTELSAVSGDGLVTLAWTDPADADFSGVVITYTGGGTATVEGRRGSVTIGGLANFSSYTFTVVAQDAAGNQAVGVSIDVTPGGCAQTDFTFDSGTGTITAFTNDQTVSIVIPDSIAGVTVTRIGSGAFATRTNLRSVVIPGTVTAMEPNAFSGCTALSFVKLPPNLQSIPAGAFDGCSSLTFVSIPSGVTAIGEAAFRDCSGLLSVSIPGSVLTVGDSAFFGCTGLGTLSLFPGVTAIGADAFGGCVNLIRVTIPYSVVQIGERAFSDCVNLDEVRLRRGVPGSITVCGEDAFDNNAVGRIIYVPAAVETEYEAAGGWAEYAASISGE